MSTGKGFKILAHTADEYIKAYGNNLEEAFESAALAMFEVMTDTKTIDPVERETIKVQAEDEVGLLYTWLESLILKFEVEGKLYSNFHVRRIEKVGEGFSLEAIVWGEAYTPDKHPSRTGVKAITYHRMEIQKEENKATVKFILDI
jgi:SHS2 domain-containing protein